jgi:GntR family transcriptional regulator
VWIHIDSGSEVPVYLQIVRQVEQEVANGLLEPGEQLPTVRALAIELAINPNTAARAYQELERRGTVQTTRGAGTFVRSRPNETTTALDGTVKLLVQQARNAGAALKDVLALIETAWRQAEGSKDDDGDE